MYTIRQDITTWNFYIITYKDNEVTKTIIDLDKYNEELTPWNITQRDEHEDFLFDLYANYNKSDKYLIKEDIKKTLKIDDEFIFTSTNTNEFISSRDEEVFNDICHDFISYYWKNE